MFMRLVQHKVKPTSSAEMAKTYSEKIIPSLQQIPGCMYACLIRGAAHTDEAISMTLWETVEHSEAYEKSGAFQRLVSELAPYFADASEWKVQLSKDYTLEYAPVQQETVVKSYRVTTASSPRPPASEPTTPLYVRILSIKLQPGKVEEFRKLYTTEILPALHNVKGCRYAFLTEGVEGGSEVISLTIWDNKDAADLYESSGLFRKLTKKVQHTFSELYQWKMAAERRSSVQVLTTEDLSVTGYSVVTGKTFH